MQEKTTSTISVLLCHVKALLRGLPNNFCEAPKSEIFLLNFSLFQQKEQRRGILEFYQISEMELFVMKAVIFANIQPQLFGRVLNTSLQRGQRVISFQLLLNILKKDNFLRQQLLLHAFFKTGCIERVTTIQTFKFLMMHFFGKREQIRKKKMRI